MGFLVHPWNISWFSWGKISRFDRKKSRSTEQILGSTVDRSIRLQLPAEQWQQAQESERPLAIDKGKLCQQAPAEQRKQSQKGEHWRLRGKLVQMAKG